MSESLLLIVIAIAAGVSVALQGQFMGQVNRNVGTLVSMFATYAVGGTIASLLFLFTRQPFSALRSIRAYEWSAGLLGLVIVGGIGYVAPRLGLSRTLVITVAAQLAAAVVIDHFGLFGTMTRAVDGVRVAGLALIIGGVWLVVKN